MKVTRYPQSCLIIEDDGRRVLVDYGSLVPPVAAADKLGHFDAVIYTHSHPDHLIPETAVAWLDAGVPVHGNTNVAEVIGDARVESFEVGETIDVAGFQVQTYDMPHCLMVSGQPADVPNTGLLFDQQLLLPGDSTDVPEGLHVKAVALPIWGPDITLKDAQQMAIALHAEIIIPVHYDVAHLNPGVFQMLGGGHGFDVRVLEHGQSTEL